MKLDHAVFFTEQAPDVIAAEQDGAHRGGSHERWGTHNALKYMQNAYIEWLAVENAEIARLSDNPLVRLLRHDLEAYGDGWGTLCFSTDRIERLETRLRQTGIRTSGVLGASRKTASGALKKWKLLFVKEEVTDRLPFPFFIQWEEDEETRRRKLTEEGLFGPESASEHVEECLLQTDDPAGALAGWCRLLDVQRDTKDSFLLSGIRFRFAEVQEGKCRLTAVRTGHTE